MNDTRKIPAENTKNGQVPVNPGVEKALSEGEEKFREIFDKVNDAIHIHEILDDGSPGRFVEVNEVACRMLQYTKEELLHHTPLDLTTDYHSRPLQEILTELATRGSALFETEHKRKDGVIIPVEVNAHVIQFGKKRRVLSVVRDITGRKRAEDKLKKSDERFRMMADWTYDMEYWIDQNNDVVYVSPSVERITGFSAGEIIAEKGLIDRIVHPDDRALWEGHIHLHTQDKEGKKPLEVEFRINTKDGSMCWIRHTCRAIFADDGTWAGRRVSDRDITDRKLAEEALQESEGRYRQLVMMLNEGIWVIDRNATTTFVNRKMAEMLGYATDEMIGKPAYAFTPAEMQEHTKQDINAAKAEEPRQREIILQKKDGTKVHALMETAEVRDSGGNYKNGIAAIIDITERKMAEEALRESEEKYHSVVAAMSEGIVLQERQGVILACNSSAERILGVTQDQMMGRTSVDPRWHAVHEDGAPFPGETHPAMVTLKTGKPCSNVIMGVHKVDGSRTWISINSQPIFYGDEIKPSAVVTSFSDITERKQMEKVVLASLKEKEILLKEIHHRVKNNLQIIASLLSLQSRYITDENVLNALKESQNRVKAMALVHERLYRSDNLSDVALSDYLRFLIDNLFGFYGANPQKVRLKFDAGDVKVDINKAIPIGLIVNELVSNSLKHAFVEGKKGDLTITLRQDKSSLVIAVHDTGPGIPVDFDWRNAKSLGLRLVISLVEQLQGTIELDRAGGTTFRITIPGKPGPAGGNS